MAKMHLHECPRCGRLREHEGRRCFVKTMATCSPCLQRVINAGKEVIRTQVEWPPDSGLWYVAQRYVPELPVIPRRRAA